ncbi:DUF2127 domain-containing protein [Dehalobacter sp. TeCB1]|uniref:DUF2127 domain-containing protein n=1 Tax=Dehalobacter sp. TeCB1 TaxID=1843715 RepID=UPI000839DAF6|nr:DUF2127 domain-containing protein [Dehalobacter sp. TeCB1]OCZ49825.1 hypothetical protein A7D23_00295 [Dehalobacter sp. TeCB1]
MNKKKVSLREIFHISFEIGLLLKGLDSLLEIIGGIFLIFLTPDRLNWLIRLLTQHELSEDPQDKFSNLLVTLGHSFSISTQDFGVFYLVSHGIIKSVLILLLWRKKLWAYPLAVLSLVLFIAYQIYRYTFSPSVFLILLTGLDIIMIFLTIMEYKRVKMQLNSAEHA